MPHIHISRNNPILLDKAIESVVMRTYKNLEFIIIDCAIKDGISVQGPLKSRV